MTARTSHVRNPEFYASLFIFPILCIRHNMLYNLTYEQYNEFLSYCKALNINFRVLQ